MARRITGLIAGLAEWNDTWAARRRIRSVHEKVLQSGSPDLIRQLRRNDSNGNAPGRSRQNDSGGRSKSLAGGLLVSDGTTASQYLAALELALADSEEARSDRRS